MKSVSIIFGLCLVAGPKLLSAQEVIATAGGHATVTGISLSWTLGEPVTNTVSNGTITLTQGFQQPRLISTAIDDKLIPGLDLSVYPNPSSSILNLKAEGEGNLLLRYTLFSVDGKVLVAEKITQTTTSIDMQRFANGNYLLQVGRKDGKPLRTFKIIKQ